MALRVQRAVVAAAFGVAAAGNLAEDCQAGLKLLQGRSDAELSARCRSSFAPEVCREVGLTLGEQPWSSDHVARGCARFAAALPETDERGLEAALEVEAPTPVATPMSLEEATLKKNPAELETRGEVASVPSLGSDSEQDLSGGLNNKADEATEATANARKAMDAPLHTDEATQVPMEATANNEADEAAQVPNKQATPNARKDMYTHLRTLMNPSEEDGIAKPAPEQAVDAPLRTLMNPSEGEGMAEPAPEKAEKGAKKRLMTPSHEGAIEEPEPERVHTARMALRHAVERATLTLGKTGSAVKRSGGLGSLREHRPEQLGNDLKLFEDIGSQKEPTPEQSGLQLSLLLGIASFAAMGTFARLSVLRTRRPERNVATRLLDAEQDAEQDSPASSAHTVVE